MPQLGACSARRRAIATDKSAGTIAYRTPKVGPGVLMESVPLAHRRQGAAAAGREI